jgi:5'-deoxynucleotidase YfbR-like HD superfamily hydrolase
MNNKTSVEDFYKQIYNLSYITRYSVVQRIKNESVAEHSFYVASIVIKLADFYAFDVNRAAAMAIVHDWSESWIDDITVATKKQFPMIAHAAEASENLVVASNFSNVPFMLWQEHKEKESVESLIVHYADILQCMQYSANEIKLG